MNDLRKNTAYFVFFVLAALILTYPLVLHLDSALRGTDIGALGDPMFNTWVIGRNADRILRLDFKNFFDGNIFHPQTKTVLYSEHLLPQTLIALPVYALSRNPILSYNFVFLLGFILSGFGMFCLARRLTGNDRAGIVAGLIYAFSPYMIAHTFQIQLVSAWGIPFAFLFLHRYAESGRLKDLFLFTFFYIIQAMSNGYYALYLTFFAGVWILGLTITKKKFKDIRWIFHWALFGVISVLVTGPFFLLYAKTHAEMAFTRSIDFFARLTSFLSVPEINVLYGRPLKRFFRPEGELFPGFVAVALAMVGIAIWIRARRIRRPAENQVPPVVLLIRRLLNILIAVSSVIVIFIIGENGLDLYLNDMQIFRAHNLKRSLFQLVVLWAIRILLDRIFGFKRPRSRNLEADTVAAYTGTLLLAFLFTFGPRGPYVYLYKYVPGFQAIRVASRFHVMVMFALAVLAAFGLNKLVRRFGTSWPAKAIFTLAAGLIVIEFLSLPIPYLQLPLRKEMPKCYQWMIENRKPGVLVEMPLPSYNKGSASIETLRMYYSLYHRNTLVNGYSGYFPPLYTELCRRQEFHDIKQLIDDFEALKVDYVLLHFDEMTEDWKVRWLDRLDDFQRDIRIVYRDQGDCLCELNPRRSDTGEIKSLAGYTKLSRTGWIVTATVNNADTRYLFDGDPKTRWESGPQVPDVFIDIDLAKPQTFRCVSMRFGPSSLDFPRGYKVELSLDGQNWFEVAREFPTVVPILAFIKPPETSLDILFPGRTARFVRITNFGKDPIYYWSIHELNIYE